MTVETTSNIAIFLGDGTAGPFDFTFKVIAKEDLTLIRMAIDTGFIDHIYTPSEFTVTGLGLNTGGNVALSSVLPVTHKLLVIRLLPLTQLVMLLNQGGFYPESVELGFDRLQMQIQQIQENLGRTLQVGYGDSIANLPRKDVRAGRFFAFDADGDPVPASSTGGGDLALREDLADADMGARLIAYNVPGTNYSIDGNQKYAQIIHVDDFGAIGDGNSANAATNLLAIQTAIDYCKALTGLRGGQGSKLHFTGKYVVGGKLTMRSGVILVGERPTFKGGMYAGLSGSVLTPSSGALADNQFFIVTEDGCQGAGMNGMNIVGTGATSKTGGVLLGDAAHTNRANALSFTNCGFVNWGIEAVKSVKCGVSVFAENMVWGLMNYAYCYSRGFHTGAFYLGEGGGVDWEVYNNEFATGLGVLNPIAVSGPELYLAAAYLGGLVAGVAHSNRYEVGDCGCSHFGQLNRYTGETFDTNAGHGVYGVQGDSNTFMNTVFSRNGVTPGAYDHIHVEAISDFARNKFVGISFNLGAPPWGDYTTVKSLIYDKRANKNFFNSYTDFLCPKGPAAPLYSGVPFDLATGGASVEISSGGLRTLTTEDGATPSVFNTAEVFCLYSGTITITDFIDGAPGQRITVTPWSGEIYIAQGSKIQLLSNIGKLRLMVPTQFVKAINGTWYQVGELAYQNSTVYNPGTMAAGAIATGSFAQFGARLGFHSVIANSSVDLQGVILTAWVSADGMIKWQLYNPAAVAVTPGNMRIRTRLMPMADNA